MEKGCDHYHFVAKKFAVAHDRASKKSIYTCSCIVYGYLYLTSTLSPKEYTTSIVMQPKTAARRCLLPQTVAMHVSVRKLPEQLVS